MATQIDRCSRCGEPFPGGLEARDYEGICPGCLAFLAIHEEGDPAPSRVAGNAQKRAAPEPPPLKRGATFRGMEVLELIGQGGMGVVYKARQIELGRLVALKILSPRLASDPEFPRRFSREAQALASLDHSNIVRVHDVGREGDLYFLVMEYVDGVNLRDLLVQKKLLPEQALRVVPQLCDALEYAHSRGIIHRDIKPENIIVSRSGIAKIADFGLAKIVKDENVPSSITQTNVVMGTADYMAPEQREGMRTADHRADIYSLGVVLYELLTGELPVGRFDPPSRRMAVDARIDDVVLRALERDPARRYQRASQMGKDVEGIVTTPAAPSQDCDILDLATGRKLGVSPGRRLSVRAVACPLIVRGWERDQMGIQVEGDYHIDPQASTPLLQSQVETRSITVLAPRGADLELLADEGSLSLERTIGSVQAKIPQGALRVSDHEGSLRVHAGQGSVSIRGLRSEYFEVRARNGSVEISELGLARGRGQVETESGSVTVRPTASASFRYYLESVSGSIQGPVSGQVGSGTGWLTVRSVSGGISMAAPPPAAAALEGVMTFIHTLTPQQVERLGKFFIINTALFLFFIFVCHTAIPAAIICIFWGMRLALEFWKGYVNSARLDGPRLARHLPAAIEKLMRFVPTPIPPPPAPPRPRMSVLSVLALLAGSLALLAAAGGSIAVLVDGGIEELNLGHNQIHAARVAAFVLGSIALFAGIAGIFLGWTSAGHVAEARGALKGAYLSQAGIFLAILALAVGSGYVYAHLRATQALLAEASPVPEAFSPPLRFALTALVLFSLAMAFRRPGATSTPEKIRVSALGSASLFISLGALLCVLGAVDLAIIASLDKVLRIRPEFQGGLRLAARLLLTSALVPAAGAVAMAVAARGAIGESQGGLRGRSLYRMGLFAALVCAVIALNGAAARPETWTKGLDPLSESIGPGGDAGGAGGDGGSGRDDTRR